MGGRGRHFPQWKFLRNKGKKYLTFRIIMSNVKPGIMYDYTYYYSLV